LKGEDRVRLSCDAMQALELSFDGILTSPFLRARQTAEIVATTLGLRRALGCCAELAPEGDVKALVRFINRLQPAPENLLLVGHEPYLSRLISLLIAGTDAAVIDLKKNGLAKLELTQKLRAGQCATLNWLLTPRQLGLLA
jgi:phosphohistidine phosphatase